MMQTPLEQRGRLKVAVFVEHDIIVRHFLHSNVFSELAAHHDLVFVFPEIGHPRVTSDVDDLQLGGQIVRLAVHVPRLRIWKGLFLAGALRLRRGAQYAHLRRFRRFIVGPKAAIIYSMLALPGILQLFSLWSQWRLHRRPNQELRKFMNVERPDVVIHPTVLDGVYINDLTEACRSHLVPLVAIINSWDNPSTKNAVIGAPDWLLVWGPQTKAHAIQFLSMPDDRVLEFGAAQFDVYRNPARINRDEFCRLHDIERASQILLYAGSSKATDEFQHLALLDAAIERGELGNVTVVYRPHPWGAAGKGGARIVGATWRHVRIESTMRGYMAGVAAGRRGISLPDYRDTHDVLSAIDALMSPLSTIILEGALHGKAVACFLPDDDDPTGHFNLALPMMHFSDLFTEPAFVVARGTTELVDAARRTLERSRDPTTAAEVRSAARYFSASFDEPYSRRLLDFVEGLRTAMDAKVKGGEACRFD